jgi:hypothetical protein
MKRLLLVGCLLGTLAPIALAPIALADVSHAATPPHLAPITRRCGSFRFGSDGSPPGPSRITARNVSCRFARALAFRGQARGWHCHLAIGLMFVCRPARGRGTVTFLGE